MQDTSKPMCLMQTNSVYLADAVLVKKMLGFR